jgi:hypothetical protein
MAKRSISIIFLALLLSSTASAEGILQVKGHAFSNVHAWQKGTEVRVSGRVSGGPARSPFQAVIHVLNDEGRTHRVAVRMNSFTGQGETFESGFKSKKRSRWWQVSQIEVVGPDPDEIRALEGQTAATRRPQASAPSEALPESGPPQCFPLEAANTAPLSKVVFFSRQPVCVTVRTLPSGRLVLMSNVAQDSPKEALLPKGEYAAKIAGRGFVANRNFSVSGNGVEIDLN